MRRRLLFAALVLVPPLLGASQEPPATSDRLLGWNPESVRTLLERVADWQLAHPSRHPATDWTQGAFYAGVMAVAAISENPRYLSAMVATGEAAGWQLGPRPYDADDHCVAQAYAEIFLRRHDPRMIGPMRTRFDWILEHPRDISLDFDPKRNPHARDRWSWCDSLFMAPPAWMRLYAATGDQRYLDFVIANWTATTDYLYDRNEHLFYRDSTYFKAREANGRKVFWGRGNGWAIAGLVRVLQFMPAEQPARAALVHQYREMAESVLSCQQTDGLWRASLLDPDDYPLKETSGSGFYCFALAWGVNEGLLDRSRYLPAVLKAWQGLVDCVDPDGQLTHVQPVGADPVRFNPDSTEVYGVGAFLLAGSEVFRLVRFGSRQ